VDGLVHLAHLPEQDAQAPDIRGSCADLFFKVLGADVPTRSSLVLHRDSFLAVQHNCRPQIVQLERPVRPNQNIIRAQVHVHPPLPVHKFQGCSHVLQTEEH
jgi:hypothetical protein